MPTSWLKPALEVHRSALPLRMATQLDAGVRVRVSGVAEVESMSVQVLPSLLARVDCRVSAAVAAAPDVVGTRSAVRRVGEKLVVADGHGPAPAQMVLPAAVLFAFHCSLM